MKKIEYIIAVLSAVLALLGISRLSFAAPTGFILHIELSPAVCKIDSTQRRTRQCLEGYSLIVSAMNPEGVNPRSCETSNIPVLSPVQKRVLMRIIPDENMQVKIWRSVGGCVAMSASQYFRMMVNYAEQLNMPSEVTTPTSIRVYRDELQQKFVQLNPSMPSQSLLLGCGHAKHAATTPLLTNVQVCYGSDGQYQRCRTEQVSSCPNQFVIQGSY